VTTGAPAHGDGGGEPDRTTTPRPSVSGPGDGTPHLRTGV
jgi:hypothetical protein